MKKFFLSSFYSLFFNLALFIVLLIGIQNNHEKKSIDFIVLQTVNLPIGFIVGSSLIFGSFFGKIFYSILKSNAED